jgi:glycosyltransferase involved in cell wall biosynthesis
MADLVSIITPTFNAEKFIAETIKSVQNQTYTHWELIIIDDCSTDNTIHLIEKICQKENRITLIKNNKNLGPAKSRNIGIQKSCGKYLTFIDADDLWKKNFIERSITEIANTKNPFVFASYERKDEHLNPHLNDFIVPNKVNYSAILKSNAISCLTAFLDVSVLGKKYMPEIKKRQDMGLWLQYLKIIPFAVGIQEPLAIYRIRKNSLSRNKIDLIKYQWAFYRKIEKLSVFQSFYYLICWMYFGFIKYKQ